MDLARYARRSWSPVLFAPSKLFIRLGYGGQESLLFLLARTWTGMEQWLLSGVRQIARRSRAAANVIAAAPLLARNNGLGHIKRLLKLHEADILVANKRDCEESARDGIAEALSKVRAHLAYLVSSAVTDRPALPSTPPY